MKEVCLDGAWTEDKGATLTYHYRKVAESRRPYLIRRALQLFRDNGFQPEHTPMAIEARPAVHWDKGRAALYILR